MNCAEIIKELEKKYPLSMAESWDNPGLQAGRREKQVKNVYIALDATDRVIQDAKAVEADLLLTHHPMIFGALKRVTTDDFTGRRLVELIQNDISYYAMHTNYDVVTMGALAGEMLKLKQPEILEVTYDDGVRKEGFGRVGTLAHSMTLRECGEYVKKVFGLETVRIFGEADRMITRAAVLPGSGKSMTGAAVAAGADVMISGDYGHHDGIDALMQGISVIDAGHYGIEKIYISQMEEFIKTRFPELKVYTERLENPFTVL